MKTDFGTALPVYCSSSFEWKNGKGVCNGSELIKLDTEFLIGDYPGIVIRSAKTGQEKYFEPVYDEDGYDGEFEVYRCDQIFVTIWNY
jgi:hypothetical protein